uniref:Coiled-coil domain-containing protein 60 n=2 Tax=Anabas testudineus TaxID=64144 RepID=A0AAQ6IH43_ANATE
MSVVSLSALTSTTVGSSLSSLVHGPEDDTGTPGAAEETERPPSESLRTLSYIQQRFKKMCQSPQNNSVADSLKASESKLQPLLHRMDNQTGSKNTTASQPNSCPAKTPPTICHLINSKANKLQELRDAFKERAEELAESYVNTLELKARERLHSGLREHQALCHMTKSHHTPHHVTGKSQETEAPNNKNNHSRNMWLSSLLSSLPEEVCKEQAVSRVLQKLSGFAEQQPIRVRPQLFLKLLEGLEPWELCLPELCVAIQIAMKYVVQLSREEYDAWLFSRVTRPP